MNVLYPRPFTNTETINDQYRLADLIMNQLYMNTLCSSLHSTALQQTVVSLYWTLLHCMVIFTYLFLHLVVSYLAGSTPLLMRSPLIELRPPQTRQYLRPINKTEVSIGLFFYISAGAAPIKLAITRLTSKSASLHYGYMFIYSHIGIYY